MFSKEDSIKIINELSKEGLYLTSGGFNPSFVKKFNRIKTEYQSQWYNSVVGSSLSEKIFLINNNMDAAPTCPICHASVLDFISPKEGYREFCSSTCRANGNHNKAEETCLKKYGVRHPAQSKVVQDKMKKTTNERYGVDNIFQRTDIIEEALLKKRGVRSVMHLEEIKQKILESQIEKYGMHPLSTPNIRKAISATNLLKYGNTCSLHSKDMEEQMSILKKTKAWERHTSNPLYLGKVKFITSQEDYKGRVDNNGYRLLYKWECNACHNPFDDYISSNKIPRCPQCYPPSFQGTMEKELATWIQSILPKETEIIFNTRRVITPLELDIYIPSYNLAIEFNELYWHCETSTKGSRGSDYHIGKTQSCKEKGIELIHIFDYEWWNNPLIVKSILSTKLGIINNKINARECCIKEITSIDSGVFLNENHIQGYAPASIRLGLFFNSELVAHLAISKNRFKEGTYEIVRYANKLDHSVRGGLSKLFSRAKLFLPEDFKLISYVDLRFFHGKSNESIGLIFSHYNKPAYMYTNDYKTVYNRMSFQKKNIEKNLSIYDDRLTEWENMQLNGYDRIWDCGTAVYSNITT